MSRSFALVARHPLAMLALSGSAPRLGYLAALRLRRQALEDRLQPVSESPAARSRHPRSYELTRQIFGNDESLLVVLRRPDVFTRENLELIERLTGRLAEVEGVRPATSLANAPEIRSAGGTVSIEPLLAGGIPGDPADLARLRERALGNPLFAGNLVSADATAPTASTVAIGDVTHDVSLITDNSRTTVRLKRRCYE